MSENPQTPKESVPSEGAGSDAVDEVVVIPGAPTKVADIEELPPVKQSSQRTRWLLYSMPVLIILLALAFKLFSLPVLSGQAAESFDVGDGEGVSQAGKGLGVVNAVEQWKAHFTLGDGYAISGNFPAATEEFQKALDGKPGKFECQVRFNLASSLEATGDGIVEKDKEGAKKLYTRGLAVVQESPAACHEKNNPANQKSEGVQLDRKEQELKDKLNDSPPPSPSPTPSPTNTPTPSPSPSPTSSQPPSPSPSPTASETGSPSPSPSGSGSASPSPSPSNSKLEELKERDKKAQEQRGLNNGESGTFTGGGESYSKPW